MLLLEVPRDTITHKREAEGQLEPDVSAVIPSDHAADGPDPPDLRHAADGTGDAAAKGKQRGEARRQFGRLVVRLGRVAGEAAAEEEVLGQRDALVDGEPVGDDQHEVLEHALEVGVARDGDGAVDERGDKGPDEARDVLGVVGEDLHAEADAVDVGAVVADDGQRDDDQAELAEGAERREYLRQQAADGVVGVRGRVRRVVDGGGGDGEPQAFDERQGQHQADEDPEEHFGARRVGGLVAGVVGGVAGPARGEAEDRGREGEHAAGFDGARSHGQVGEGAAVGEDAEDDEEDDEARHPGDHLVVVDCFVAEAGDDEGARGDDDDAGPAGDVRVDGVDELGADDDVDGAPAETGEAVEEGDDFDAVEAEPEPGQDHLAHAEARAKGREEGHGHGAEHVDEEDGEEGVDEAEGEDGDGEDADGQGRHAHVCRTPHRADLVDVFVCSFVGGDALDAADFEAEFRG